MWQCGMAICVFFHHSCFCDTIMLLNIALLSHGITVTLVFHAPNIYSLRTEQSGEILMVSALVTDTDRITFSFYPRDAMIAWVIVIATCLSVCLSVTRRYCVKMKKASVMISSLSGSPKILVFWRQILSPNSKGFPQTGASKKGGVWKFSDFLVKHRICISQIMTNLDPMTLYYHLEQAGWLVD